ncbi:MAG: cell division protein ZapA [Bacteriovoracaceae bacterium]|nr:cell division protein ZapA [Bacteriovoracaceae bacterium]
MSNKEEFDVLGFKVSFRPESDMSGEPRACDVVQKVEQIAHKIKLTNPQLPEAKIAVLVALQMALEYMKLESEYREDIKALETPLLEILNVVESINPPLS